MLPLLGGRAAKKASMLWIVYYTPFVLQTVTKRAKLGELLSCNIQGAVRGHALYWPCFGRNLGKALPCPCRSGGTFSSAYEALRGGGGGGGVTGASVADNDSKQQKDGHEGDGDSEGSPPRGRDAMSPEYADTTGE